MQDTLIGRISLQICWKLKSSKINLSNPQSIFALISGNKTSQARNPCEHPSSSPTSDTRVHHQIRPSVRIDVDLFLVSVDAFSHKTLVISLSVYACLTIAPWIQATQALYTSTHWINCSPVWNGYAWLRSHQPMTFIMTHTEWSCWYLYCKVTNKRYLLYVYWFYYRLTSVTSIINHHTFNFAHSSRLDRFVTENNNGF